MADSVDIFHAVKTSDLATIREILDKEPLEVNRQNQIGVTPLILAAGLGDTVIIEELLKPPARNCIDTQLCDHRERNALIVAEEFGHEKICELLKPIYLVESGGSTEVLPVTFSQKLNDQYNLLCSKIQFFLYKCITIIRQPYIPLSIIAAAIVILVVSGTISLHILNSDYANQKKIAKEPFQPPKREEGQEKEENYVATRPRNKAGEMLRTIILQLENKGLEVSSIIRIEKIDLRTQSEPIQICQIEASLDGVLFRRVILRDNKFDEWRLQDGSDFGINKVPQIFADSLVLDLVKLTHKFCYN